MSSANFLSKSTFLKKKIQEYRQSFKQFGSSQTQPLGLIFVLVAQKNCLIETVLLSTHNIYVSVKK